MNTLKLCRLCANNAEDIGSINLFDKSNGIIIQQIKELTGLIIKDMPRQMLPRYFCTKCKEKLLSACEFRRQIIQTQSYFKSKDYKKKFETDDLEGSKPTFAFVPLNEYEDNETLDTKSFSDDSEDRTDGILVAAECVEATIKEETSLLNPQNIGDENTNISNTKRIKTKTRKRPSKELCQWSHLEKFDATCPPSKMEHVDVCTKEENESSPEDNFDCMERFSDNNVSDNYSTEDSYSDEDLEDPDFVVKLIENKPKTDNPNKPRDKEELDILKNRQFSCHLCQHPLESLISLKIHFQKQHKKEKFKCDLCEEKFPTTRSLVRHFRMHQGEKEFKCHFCDMSFKYSTVRCRHERRVHAKDPPFLCFICGKTFITCGMGRDHMTVHTKERAYHCTVCKADFLRKTHLNTHYRSMTHKNNEQKLKEEILMANVSDSAQQLDASNQFLLNL